jgi:hypothetical protein
MKLHVLGIDLADGFPSGVFGFEWEGSDSQEMFSPADKDRRGFHNPRSSEGRANLL